MEEPVRSIKKYLLILCVRRTDTKKGEENSPTSRKVSCQIFFTVNVNKHNYIACAFKIAELWL